MGARVRLSASARRRLGCLDGERTRPGHTQQGQQALRRWRINWGAETEEEEMEKERVRERERERERKHALYTHELFIQVSILPVFFFSFLQASKHKEMWHYSAALCSLLNLKHKAVFIIVKQNQKKAQTVTYSQPRWWRVRVCVGSALSEGVIPQAKGDVESYHRFKNARWDSRCTQAGSGGYPTFPETAPRIKIKTITVKRDPWKRKKEKRADTQQGEGIRSRVFSEGHALPVLGGVVTKSGRPVRIRTTAGLMKTEWTVSEM